MVKKLHKFNTSYCVKIQQRGDFKQIIFPHWDWGQKIEWCRNSTDSVAMIYSVKCLRDFCHNGGINNWRIISTKQRQRRFRARHDYLKEKSDKTDAQALKKKIGARCGGFLWYETIFQNSRFRAGLICLFTEKLFAN